MSDRKEQLRKFLLRLDSPTVTLTDPKQSSEFGPMQEFLLTYFGKCFIEGYRVMEKIEQNIFILSLMECQTGGNNNYFSSPHPLPKHAMFRIINIQFNEKINEDRQLRTQKFQRLKQIAEFLCADPDCEAIEYHLLFAVNFMYAVLSSEAIKKGSVSQLHKFYNRDYGITKKSDKEGFKILDEIEQGKKLHLMLELYLKGNGTIQNRKYFSKNVLHHSKFSYKLDKLINNVSFIAGKEMIEGGYVSLSVQKWMRKFSKKSFRRFDLLLRKHQKVCIIDWKFSRDEANDKIKTKMFVVKNLQYFQLARKQYNSEVELKFYCFHQHLRTNLHDFSVANYDPSIEKVELDQNMTDPCNQILVESSSEEEFKSTNRFKFKSVNSIDNLFNRISKLNSSKNNDDRDNEYGKLIYDQFTQTFQFQRFTQRQPVRNSSKVLSHQQSQLMSGNHAHSPNRQTANDNFKDFDKPSPSKSIHQRLATTIHVDELQINNQKQSRAQQINLHQDNQIVEVSQNNEEVVPIMQNLVHDKVDAVAVQASIDSILQNRNQDIILIENNSNAISIRKSMKISKTFKSKEKKSKSKKSKSKQKRLKLKQKSKSKLENIAKNKDRAKDNMVSISSSDSSSSSEDILNDNFMDEMKLKLRSLRNQANDWVRELRSQMEDKFSSKEDNQSENLAQRQPKQESNKRQEQKKQQDSLRQVRMNSDKNKVKQQKRTNKVIELIESSDQNVIVIN